MFFAWLLVKLTAPRVRIRKSNDGCEFDWRNEIIYYDRRQSFYEVGFLRHLEEKHHFSKPARYSSRLWSILHEVGHYYNQDIERDELTAAQCALVPVEEAIKSPKIQDLYYDLEDEFAATEWACDCINNHPKLARIFSVLL